MNNPITKMAANYAISAKKIGSKVTKRVKTYLDWAIEKTKKGFAFLMKKTKKARAIVFPTIDIKAIISFFVPSSYKDKGSYIAHLALWLGLTGGLALIIMGTNPLIGALLSVILFPAIMPPKNLIQGLTVIFITYPISIACMLFPTLSIVMGTATAGVLTAYTFSVYRTISKIWEMKHNLKPANLSREEITRIGQRVLALEEPTK